MEYELFITKFQIKNFRNSFLPKNQQNCYLPTSNHIKMREREKINK